MLVSLALSFHPALAGDEVDLAGVDLSVVGSDRSDGPPTYWEYQPRVIKSGDLGRCGRYLAWINAGLVYDPATNTVYSHSNSPGLATLLLNGGSADVRARQEACCVLNGSDVYLATTSVNEWHVWVSGPGWYWQGDVDAGRGDLVCGDLVEVEAPTD